MMKKILCLCLTLLVFASVFVACGNKGTDGGSGNGVKMLSFAEAQTIDEMKKYDGKQVTIMGYMSTLSPASGNFMYLMNMPYQSCPFCIPNTSQLSNTLAIYAKDGGKFEFSDRLIQVTGKMDFCDDGTYEDTLGYEYSYRIIDASYEIVNVDNLSDELKQWQEISASGIISEIYDMYDYLNFVCSWTTYTADFGSGRDYVYAADAKNYLQKDGAQFNYGYKEGYFDAIISKAEAYDNAKVKVLVENLKEAKELAARAVAALENDEYTTVKEYSGYFGDGRTQYKLNDETLGAKNSELYRAFASWLASWEIK